MVTGEIMSDIRHIACPIEESDLFATARFKHTVSVWSFAQRRKVAQFDTVLDFGGTRLAIIPGKKPAVIAGAYNVHGVCAYSALDGRLLWQRKDLKKVQYVCWLGGGRGTQQVGVGFDSRAFQLLELRSGRTISSLRAVRELYPTRYAGVALQVGKSSISLCSLPDWSILWKQALRSFGVLHAAIGPRSVVFSEAGGSLRCFDIEGRALWEWAPGPGKHVLRTAWSESSDTWLAIEWPYEKGGPDTLVVLDRDGHPISRRAIGDVAECEFFAGGRYVVTSEGQVLRTPRLQPSWKFGP